MQNVADFESKNILQFHLHANLFLNFQAIESPDEHLLNLKNR